MSTTMMKDNTTTQEGLTLERTAEVAAHLRVHLGLSRADVLRRFDLTEERWERVLAAWTGVIAEEAAGGNYALAQRYGTSFVATKVRLEQDPSPLSGTLDGAKPSALPVTPFQPNASQVLPVLSPVSQPPSSAVFGTGTLHAAPKSGSVLPFAQSSRLLTATLEPVSSASIRPALPFVEGEVRAPLAATHRLDTEGRFGTGTLPSAASPALPATPFEKPAAEGALDALSLERYASLQIDLASSRDRAQVLQQYGLTEAQLRAMDAHWNEQMIKDSTVRDAFLKATTEQMRARDEGRAKR